jgi:hypothetical protein
LGQEILLAIKVRIEEMMIMISTVKSLKAAMDMTQKISMSQSMRLQIIDLMFQEIMISMIADMKANTKTKVTTNMDVKIMKIDMKETIDKKEKINIQALINPTDMSSRANMNANQIFQGLKDTQINMILDIKDE